MKRIIFYTLIFLIACVAGVHAQSFQPTYGNICAGCVPPGYEIVSGLPAVSTPKGLAGNQNNAWTIPQLNFPNPPTYNEGEQDVLPLNTQKSFLTLKHQNLPKADQKDIVRVIVSKFVPGKLYNFKFHTLFSKLAGTSSAISATVRISTGGVAPMNLKTVTINNTGDYTWKQTAIGFTPSTEVLIFTFSVDAAASTTGYVNFDIGNYPFDCVIPTAQVQLLHSNVTTKYPCSTISLDSYIKSALPPNGKEVWKKGSFSSLASLTDPVSENAPVGEYYAFFYDVTMPLCYNADVSSAKVQYKYIETQVNLLTTQLSNECPNNIVDIRTAEDNNNISSSEEIRWFINNTHQGVPENASAISTSGDYYAFFYHKVHNCYSTDLSTSKVTVTINACCAAGTAQVGLLRSGAVNSCPATTVNLNNSTVNNQPQGASLVWFKDASHTVAVADPTKAGAGSYYAFYKDNVTGCFNTDLSTSKLTVTTNACETKVNLNLKVFLQGSTTQENGVAIMRNDLQVYPTGPSTFGLLPTQDPYGGGAVYPEIKSTFSKVGNVVDWVKVEIRSMQNPSIILESKSLLLRVDGTVLDVDGFAPKFNPQFGGVRIAVKHRNHLGVLGLGIVSFNAGTVSYDFTADISKAYNVGATAQMVLTNGVWCMISGDIQQDFTVDNADLSNERISFNKGDFDAYKVEDLNLDGIVDNVDISFFKTSFNKGYFSTLINY